MRVRDYVVVGALVCVSSVFLRMYITHKHEDDPDSVGELEVRAPIMLLFLGVCICLAPILFNLD